MVCPPARRSRLQTSGLMPPPARPSVSSTVFTTTAQGMINPPAGISGVDGSPITVKALYDGGVLITGHATRAPVLSGHNDWFVVEGVNACCSSGSVVDLDHSSHNVIRRVAAWDAADGNYEHLRRPLRRPQPARRRRRLGYRPQDLLVVPGWKLHDHPPRLGPLGRLARGRTEDGLLARLQQLRHARRKLHRHLERREDEADVRPARLLRPALDGQRQRYVHQLRRQSALCHFRRRWPGRRQERPSEPSWEASPTSPRPTCSRRTGWSSSPTSTRSRSKIPPQCLRPVESIPASALSGSMA